MALNIAFYVKEKKGVIMTKRVNLGLKEALKEKAERKRKRQELEDKGWVTQKIGEKTLVLGSNDDELHWIDVDPVEEPKPIPLKVPEVDPKEFEIARLKALLAEKEAAVIEDIIEEEVLETAAELAEQEVTIKEDGD